MNRHEDDLRLDHQPVAASKAGLSRLWAEAKTEHASSCATNLRQGPGHPPCGSAPLELPGFDATMNPSDSRRGQTTVIDSRGPLPLPSSGTAPGLSGSPRVFRYPLSPTTPESRAAAHARCFTVHAGFALYGRLAALRFFSRGRDHPSGGARFTRVTADSFDFRGFVTAGRPVQRPVACMANEQHPSGFA
jgi:hypothetical protein